MDDKQMVAIDTQGLPWEERFNEKLGRALYRKNLMIDPDTGMEVRLVRYPAGVINVRHTHPCAHGMYVLEGTLVTQGGRYGRDAVWFPEGLRWAARLRVRRHGLFVTNKPFGNRYREADCEEPDPFRVPA
jgi:hypothetical protein